MTPVRTSLRSILFGLVFPALLLPGPLTAQETESGWKNVAELTLVLTAGNATSNTFGFKNTADYKWTNASFQLAAGGVRARAGTTTRTATGTAGNFTVKESTDTKTTAESYFLKGRLDRKVTDASFLFAGAGWDRNTFAGVDNRYTLATGAGHTFFEEEARRFKGDVGVTFTKQEDVVENPDVSDSFMGVRGSFDYFRKLSETTAYGSVLVADQNLKETEDLRADWTNSLTVAMSAKLALKLSYQLLFDNQPALVGVPLSGTTTTVLTPLGKTDSIFSVAIVANF